MTWVSVTPRPVNGLEVGSVWLRRMDDTLNLTRAPDVIVLVYTTSDYISNKMQIPTLNTINNIYVYRECCLSYRRYDI